MKIYEINMRIYENNLDLQLHLHQVLQADGVAEPRGHARADEGRLQGGAEESVF